MRNRKKVTRSKTIITKKRIKVTRTVWVVEPCYVRLGKAIAEQRAILGITQTALAKKLGISRPSLVNMEAGRQRILLHHIFMIEKVFGVFNELISVARGRNLG